MTWVIWQSRYEKIFIIVLLLSIIICLLFIYPCSACMCVRIWCCCQASISKTRKRLIRIILNYCSFFFFLLVVLHYKLFCILIGCGNFVGNCFSLHNAQFYYYCHRYYCCYIILLCTFFSVSPIFSILGFHTNYSRNMDGWKHELFVNFLVNCIFIAHLNKKEQILMSFGACEMCTTSGRDKIAVLYFIT